MALEQYLTSDGVIANMHARCKRDALSQIAAAAADLTGVSVPQIEEALMSREQLGSTGVGHGVAIPHGKINDLDKIFALFVKLDSPVAFDAIDDEPVDLIFMLLAPEDATAAHLKALAKATRLLRDDVVRQQLRGADTSEALFAIATETAKSDAA